jgi:hypothetical protein
VTTQPGDELAAGPAGEDPYAGDALYLAVARGQVTATLKAALAQGRLTPDEHDERVALVAAARAPAELAALTADLPVGISARLPAARDVWIGVGLIVAAVSGLAALVALAPDNSLAFLAALGAAVTILVAPAVTAGLLIDVRHQRRSSRRNAR